MRGGPATRALTIGGCGVYVLVMAALHVLRPDLSPLQRGMSRYAGGDTLVPATIAFAALAVALLALAAHLWRRSREASRALIAAAGGIVLVVLTPIGGPSPSSVSLTIHTVGGGVFYLAIAWAMLRHSPDSAQQTLSRSMLAALTLFFLGGAGVPGPRLVTGLLQRVVIGIAVAWLVRATALARDSHAQERGPRRPRKPSSPRQAAKEQRFTQVLFSLRTCREQRRSSRSSRLKES